MKIRDEYTCPLELVHDMIKGKWKTIIFMAAAPGRHFISQTGKGYRRYYAENAFRTAERADHIWIGRKEIL